MAERIGQKIKMPTVDELLGVSNQEGSVDIKIEEIRPFANHPFKVLDDEKMQELVESVKANGVLTPVLVRPMADRHYEMISGHRRMHASKLAGLDTIPAIIRDMSDDEAVLQMVDSNIQREELLPSEKAFAYKMKLEAMKRVAGRPAKNNGGQNDHNLKGLKSRDILAEEVGESPKQIQRFIRLTELIPDLLDLVDRKKINFTIGVEISYFDKNIQQWLYEYITENCFIKPEQIAHLKKYVQVEKINQGRMIDILNEAIARKKVSRKITLSDKKLDKYFPAFYSSDDMENIITGLLEEWKKSQEGAGDGI